MIGEKDVGLIEVERESLRAMLEENRHLRAKVTEMQADQTAQLTAARAAAWAMAAAECDREYEENWKWLSGDDQGDVTAFASRIRAMAAHASVGAIPMVLDCPKCNAKHVDEGEWATTRIHRKHLCALCGHVWNPANVPTVGVERLP